MKSLGPYREVPVASPGHETPDPQRLGQGTAKSRSAKFRFGTTNPGHFEQRAYLNDHGGPAQSPVRRPRGSLSGGPQRLDQFLRAQGVEVTLVMHFDNIQKIKEAVALGQGISILPARTMQAEIAQGRLVVVKLNAPGLARPLGIVHRRKKNSTAPPRASSAY
jgi:DNA-binding transcriptional LysR family regulator